MTNERKTLTTLNVPISNKLTSVDETRTYLYETRTQNLSNQVFADDVVTSQEMLYIKLNHEEIIRDFLCACDLKEKMEKNPTQYSKSEMNAINYIVDHLMRAREKSYAMMNRASYNYGIPEDEKRRRQERRKHKEHMDINFNLLEIFTLNGNASEVIQYARKQEKERRMTPKEAQKTEERIKGLVNQLSKKGVNDRAIMQFIREGLNERATV